MIKKLLERKKEITTNKMWMEKIKLKKIIGGEPWFKGSRSRLPIKRSWVRILTLKYFYYIE